jgi:histidyl-tRNA synthetase
MEWCVQHPVERVRGFSDVDGAAQRRFSIVVRSLLTSFQLADFTPVDVPIVEHLDLYLRKNGAQVLPKIYAFTDQGKRDVALRPEFTASVIRAFAPRLGQPGGIARVSYAGPVFRYEKPQRATGRQFTQAGVELLGDDSVLAEAELLALACHSARDLGVAHLRLVIGHLGPLRALLSHLQVDGYAEQYLLEHLEYFNRGAEQQSTVREWLGLFAADPADEGSDEALEQSLAGALRDTSPEEARQLVAAMLDQMGFDLSGSTRTPEEILDRVLAKARRRAARRDGTWREGLERALTFVERLGQIRGEPEEALAATEDLLRQYDVPLGTLDELRGMLRVLRAYDLADIQVQLAPAMARGIAYYSGLIFELYAQAPDGISLQICGGGRYDGLAQALTGHACPALGFAFGVERLLHALHAQQPAADAAARVAIMVRREEWIPAALALATTLRERALPCAMQEGTRWATRYLERARRAGYAALIALPGDEGTPALHILDDAAVDAVARASIDGALGALRAPRHGDLLPGVRSR